MTKIFIKLSVLFFVFAQLGCGGVSKSSCLKTDWSNTGFEDGKAGKASEEILEMQSTCASKDVNIPIKEYKEGWLRGIALYCSVDNAYKLGLEGEEAKVKNCPIEYQADFNQSYKKGQDYAAKQEKIKELEKLKAEKAKKAKKTSKEIAEEIKELKNSN